MLNDSDVRHVKGLFKQWLGGEINKNNLREVVTELLDEILLAEADKEPLVPDSPAEAIDTPANDETEEAETVEAPEPTDG